MIFFIFLYLFLLATTIIASVISSPSERKVEKETPPLADSGEGATTSSNCFLWSGTTGELLEESTV